MTKNPSLLILLVLDLMQLITGAYVFQCPSENQTTLEKRIGTRPARNASLLEAVFTLRHKERSQQIWNSLECLRRCLSLQECHSVLVLHQDMECVGFPFAETEYMIVDNDANYFVKQCFSVPESCQRKLWTLESSNGYRLLSQDSIIKTLHNITNEECSRQLIQASDTLGLMKSAQFQLLRSENGYSLYNGNGVDNFPKTVGKCIICNENKFTEPESFRVAGKDTWYKENQCAEDLPKTIDRCSYEEYYNQTLKHFDVMIHGISTSECKSRCETEQQFNCRGFTTIPFKDGRSHIVLSLGSEDNTPKSCLLHSEDMLTHGSWLLLRKPDAVYYRRVTCLNVSVVCSASSMTVTYWPRSDFRGRIYASGYSETCSANGMGKANPTKLVIPFNNPECGVNQAFAITDDGINSENKTLMYTLLVIQNNPIIQAQGDRFIRVGCVAPPTFNLTLAADINVNNDSEEKTQGGNSEAAASIPAASIINTTGSANVPKIRMYIINDNQGGDKNSMGGAVSLGESIELRIEADSPNNDIDIHAYHLVASSQLGDSSVLLLDGRGCPTGQVDFPALVRSKVPGEGRNSSLVRLSTKFRAFRFPNSQVVKFNVMVQFCPGKCEEVNCDILSSVPVRVSRSVTFNNSQMTESDSSNDMPEELQTVQLENASIRFLNDKPKKSVETRNANVVVASTETGGRVKEICKEIKESHESKIPLELSLIVASNDVFTADSLIYGENNKILVAAVEDTKPAHNNMICIHEALFISITFIWLLVQIIILAACMIVIKRYRSFVEDNQYQKDYHSFDNLGFDNFTPTRRVHWPDQHGDPVHH